MDTSRAVALGFFDGVHIGHGALLRRTRAAADRLGCPAAAMSFDTHPSALLSASPSPLLSTMEERTLLMRRLYGMDEVIFEHFDRGMMEMPWETFVEEYLVRQLHAKLLERGDLDGARAFLGHPQLVSGVVAHGNHLGHTLGFPTANLPFAPGVLVPPYGVYIAQAELDGRRFPAVVNIGLHPTAGSLPAPLLEANLLDFQEDLYGKPLSVWLYSFLRPERKFSSLDALTAQIGRDAARTREYFKEAEI